MFKNKNLTKKKNDNRANFKNDECYYTLPPIITLIKGFRTTQGTKVWAYQLVQTLQIQSEKTYV